MIKDWQILVYNKGFHLKVQFLNPNGTPSFYYDGLIEDKKELRLLLDLLNSRDSSNYIIVLEMLKQKTNVIDL